MILLSLFAAVSLFYTIFFRHSDGRKKKDVRKKSIGVGRKLAAYSKTTVFLQNEIINERYEVGNGRRE